MLFFFIHLQILLNMTFLNINKDTTLCLIIIICNIIDISTVKNFNVKGLPLIVWWTDLLYPHTGKYSEIKCSTSNCISSRKRRYQKENISIAYLFYGTDFDGSNLPLPRLNNHVWTLLHEESPMNNFIFSHHSGIKLFNYTSTFSRESDFPLTTQFIPSIEYLIKRKPVSIHEKNAYRTNGIAPILYLQSHCNVASDRDRYIKNLMNFIPVDSYGACLHNRDLPSHLVLTHTYNDEDLFSFISNYKFHIAFENAICDDYITEKLIRAFHVGSVPIYKGSPSVQDWVPSEESIIIADNFNSPSELADFVLKLDQNDELYEKYLEYKHKEISNEYLKKNLLKRRWGVNDPNKIDFIQGFECYVCDKIHQLNKLSMPSIASKKHMNCHQPHMSLISKDQIKIQDEWLQEDWVESYWFAYDQAKAIEHMINNKEENTSKFMEYISRNKYHN